MNRTRKIISAAVCVALCVVLPIALHMIPNAGSLISPMHIPVFLCGIICGPFWGLCCGIIGPVLSSVITQMPPMAILPSMMVELAAYGLVSGLMMKLVHTGKYIADVYISLTVSMIFGRIIAGFARALIFSYGSYTFSLWVSSYFVGTLPAIAVHLIVVPIIVAALKKSGVIS